MFKIISFVSFDLRRSVVEHLVFAHTISRQVLDAHRRPRVPHSPQIPIVPFFHEVHEQTRILPAYQRLRDELTTVEAQIQELAAKRTSSTIKPPEKPIVLVGGGIANAILAHALLKHGFKVKIRESRPQFRVGRDITQPTTDSNDHKPTHPHAVRGNELRFRHDEWFATLQTLKSLIPAKLYQRLVNAKQDIRTDVDDFQVSIGYVQQILFSGLEAHTRYVDPVSETEVHRLHQTGQTVVLGTGVHTRHHFPGLIPADSVIEDTHYHTRSKEAWRLLADDETVAPEIGTTANWHNRSVYNHTFTDIVAAIKQAGINPLTITDSRQLPADFIAKLTGELELQLAGFIKVLNFALRVKEEAIAKRKPIPEGVEAILNGTKTTARIIFLMHQDHLPESRVLDLLGGKAPHLTVQIDVTPFLVATSPKAAYLVGDAITAPHVYGASGMIHVVGSVVHLLEHLVETYTTGLDATEQAELARLSRARLDLKNQASGLKMTELTESIRFYSEADTPEERLRDTIRDQIGHERFESRDHYVETVRKVGERLTIEDLPTVVQETFNGKQALPATGYLRHEVFLDKDLGLSAVAFVFGTKAEANNVLATIIHDHHRLAPESSVLENRTVSVSLTFAQTGNIDLYEEYFRANSDGTVSFDRLVDRSQTRLTTDNLGSNDTVQDVIHRIVVTKTHPNEATDGRFILLHFYATENAKSPNRKIDYRERIDTLDRFHVILDRIKRGYTIPAINQFEFSAQVLGLLHTIKATLEGAGQRDIPRQAVSPAITSALSV
ncbi:MAG: hypothetical protein AB7F28_00070 [Candidatus Margulisiibacteriota bacterium]